MGLVTSATVVPGADGARVIGLGYVRTAAVQVGGTLQVDAEDDDGVTLASPLASRPSRCSSARRSRGRGGSRFRQPKEQNMTKTIKAKFTDGVLVPLWNRSTWPTNET